MRFVFLFVFLVPVCLFAEPTLKVELIVSEEPIVLTKDQLALASKAHHSMQMMDAIIESPKLDDGLREEMTKLEKKLEGLRTQKQGIGLKLKITNIGDGPATIHYGPDMSTNYLKVEGPEAVNVSYQGPMTADFRTPNPTTIEVGKSKLFPIKELSHEKRDMSRWLIGKPGEYEVSLRLVLGLGADEVELKTAKSIVKIGVKK